MALIPSYYLDTVVALGYSQSDGSIKYVATGFLYDHIFEKDGNGSSWYQLFLVTNPILRTFLSGNIAIID